MVNSPVDHGQHYVAVARRDGAIDYGDVAGKDAGPDHAVPRHAHGEGGGGVPHFRGRRANTQ